MSEKDENHSGFMGTYFDRNSVLKLSKITAIFGWVIFAFFIIQWFYAIWQNVYNAFSGNYPLDPGFFIYNSGQPFQGAMVLLVLLAASKILLILLDIEDNTRRAAWNADKGAK